MNIIDGNAIAKIVLNKLADTLQSLKHKPTIAFLRIGDDPASIAYVNKKQSVAKAVGIESQLYVFDITTTQTVLIDCIQKLNNDPHVHGILVQAPLPKHICEKKVFSAIHPDKDVDGFHPLNLGKLCQEDDSGFVACTPLGILELLKNSNISIAGRHIVVVGRSVIVGKPTSLLLLRKNIFGNATVTTCHSHTHNLKTITQMADILIVAMGKPRLITADMVKHGAVVIDVGTTRVEGPQYKNGFALKGDVEFKEVAPKTSFITPVPGGVGPMTIASLLLNTLRATELRNP